MKRISLLVLAGAGLVAGMYVQGCSGSGGTDGGGSTSCHADTDCAAGQACDTASGLCDTKCMMGSDCPMTEKTCATLPGTGSTMVCQCSTDQLCGDGFVCNTTDHVCQQKCTSDSSCQGYSSARHCDMASGQCVASGGQDAGGGACGASMLCASGQYCNAGTCAANPNGTPSGACTTVNTQDDCNSGNVCFAGSDPALYSQGNGCLTIGDPETASDGNTCTSAGGSQYLQGGGATIWGLTSMTVSDPDPSTSCSGNGNSVIQYKGYWYDPSNSVPTGSFNAGGTNTIAVYNAVREVKSDGTMPSMGTTYYQVDINTDGTFDFEECSDNTGVKGIVLVGNGNSNTACLP